MVARAPAFPRVAAPPPAAIARQWDLRSKAAISGGRRVFGADGAALGGAGALAEPAILDDVIGPVGTGLDLAAPGALALGAEEHQLAIDRGDRCRLGGEFLRQPRAVVAVRLDDLETLHDDLPPDD